MDLGLHITQAETTNDQPTPVCLASLTCVCVCLCQSVLCLQVVSASINFTFNLWNGFVITYPSMPYYWQW